MFKWNVSDTFKKICLLGRPTPKADSAFSNPGSMNLNPLEKNSIASNMTTKLQNSAPLKPLPLRIVWWVGL